MPHFYTHHPWTHARKASGPVRVADQPWCSGCSRRPVGQAFGLVFCCSIAGFTASR